MNSPSKIPANVMRDMPQRIPRLAQQVFDIAQVQNDIEETLRGTADLPAANPSQFAPRPPLPDYVTHLEDVSEVGRLTAEAVVKDFEAAAKEVEAMGNELTEAVKRCEDMAAGARSAIEELKETAAQAREEGKRIFLQIERSAQMTAEVRGTCKAIREKLSTP